MGQSIEARCLDCGGTDFDVSHGGGMTFHLLRCDRCGETKRVSFFDLGLIHLRYVKGLSVPYCIASRERDRFIQEELDIEPLAEEDYFREVEAFAGSCPCGGSFTFDAPPRCPYCHSTRLVECGGALMYD
jgi:hypothetical protein